VYSINHLYSVSEESVGLTLLHLHRRWTRFVKYLAGFVPALSTGAFVRLVIMVIIQMIGGVAFTSMLLWRALTDPGFHKHDNWANIHSYFSTINSVPTAIIPVGYYRWLTIFWWLTPISAFLVFALFSFAMEVMAEYVVVWSWLSHAILRRQIGEGKPSIPKQ
jgi:hypothetical protein